MRRLSIFTSLAQVTSCTRSALLAPMCHLCIRAATFSTREEILGRTMPQNDPAWSLNVKTQYIEDVWFRPHVALTPGFSLRTIPNSSPTSTHVCVFPPHTSLPHVSVCSPLIIFQFGAMFAAYDPASASRLVDERNVVETAYNADLAQCVSSRWLVCLYIGALASSPERGGVISPTTATYADAISLTVHLHASRLRHALVLKVTDS